ncbi:carbohydrate ABC transporter permease [Microbacteriaceae bacterium K1510]|nr:carbohydrate ABC transporter permease [Microbacteriaceae bacterium K1510]
MTRRLPIVARLGRHAALLVTTAFMLVPFVWMLSLSIKPPAEIFDVSFHFWPKTFYGLENYGHVFDAAPMLRFLANGVFVCAAILTCQIVTSVPIAYALAKLEFPMRSTLFSVVLVAILIPYQALSVPLFMLFYYLGILDTYAALILPSAVSPIAIFLLRQFFKTVPDDLINAARLDGLNEFSIAWRIVVPQAKSALIAFAMLSVVVHWNDLFWPSIVTHSQELATPPLGVVLFRNSETGSAYGPVMAAATTIVAPLLIAFLAAQRWFVEGLTSGAVK